MHGRQQKTGIRTVGLLLSAFRGVALAEVTLSLIYHYIPPSENPIIVILLTENGTGDILPSI
jgi:hypothetical protein